MANLKIQEKILTLGKGIVKELELDPGVDTLSKWMAHYVSEMIVSAENLSGNKKAKAQKQCFDIVSKLWEQRWSIPHNKPFLKDFESLMETLDKLNPDKDIPFFLSPQSFFEIEEEINTSETYEINNDSNDIIDENINPQTYLDSALRVDKLARKLIAELLKRAVKSIKLSSEREDLIRNSIEAIDYPESRLIKITSDYGKYLKNEKEDTNETQSRITEIKSKIDELEELTSIAQSLASQYRKELLTIEK